LILPFICPKTEEARAAADTSKILEKVCILECCYPNRVDFEE
jgi:hypothetical protein